MWHNGSGEKRLHVLMQKVHTIRNDKNKKRKEAHAQSLAEQAKRFAKKAESLDEVRLSRASSRSSLLVHLVYLVMSHERLGVSRRGATVASYLVASRL
jgi:hypothetical protein